jgi:hypothetical protein
VFGCVVCYLAGRRLDSSDSWVWNMRGAEGKKSIAQSVVVLHLLQHARLQSARNRWGGLFGHTVVYDAGLCMVFLASEDPDFDLRFIPPTAYDATSFASNIEHHLWLTDTFTCAPNSLTRYVGADKENIACSNTLVTPPAFVRPDFRE